MGKCPFFISLLVSILLVCFYGLSLTAGVLPKAKSPADAVMNDSNMVIAQAVRDIKTRVDMAINGDEEMDYSSEGGPKEYVPKEDLAARMANAQLEAESIRNTDEDHKLFEETPEEAPTDIYDSGEEEDSEEEESEEDENSQAAALPAGYIGKTELPEGDTSALGSYDGFYTVEDSYFTGGDTVFIGDSRQKGFGIYSGIPNIVLYAKEGYAAHQAFTKKFIDSPLGKLTLEEAMAAEPGRFKKIYIKFGLNEIGGSAEAFKNAYYRLIDMLKYYQPDAVIYIQSIIHVTKIKSQGSTVFNNDNINSRNEAVKEVADREHVCFLDLNSVFTNEEGCLPADYASDGIHIKAQYMQPWIDFLRTHAVLAPSDYKRVLQPESAENAVDSSANEGDSEQNDEVSEEDNSEEAKEEAQPEETAPETPQQTVPPTPAPVPATQAPAGQGTAQNGTNVIETDWETGGGIY
ncbi:MAG: hypothetical protein J6O55_07825 [Lachnospiraceae bacterium]|nr:hypothetical protein [Lachnospiraceae bacterium]